MAKTKGSSILLLVKALRMNREQAAKILSPRLHYYLEDRIMVSNWYPEEDYIELLRTLGTILRPQEPEPFEMMGGISARVGLTGLYKNHLFEGNPAKTLRRGIQTWSAYHDSGQMNFIHQPGEGPRKRATLELVGYELACDEVCRTTTGWIRTELAMAGAQDLDIRHSRCTAKGDGLCRWDLLWTDRQTA